MAEFNLADFLLKPSNSPNFLAAEISSLKVVEHSRFLTPIVDVWLGSEYIFETFEEEAEWLQSKDGYRSLLNIYGGAFWGNS